MDLFEDPIPLPFDMPDGPGYFFEPLENISGYKIKIPNGELLYVENFFSKRISDRTVEYLSEVRRGGGNLDEMADPARDVTENTPFANIRWKQDFIRLYGKDIPLPRLTSWYGDSDAAYTYSGIRSLPNEWNAGLLYLKNQIEKFSDATYNSVLLNWYRHGDDHLGWHADDERELGVNPTIASANFGETRDFLVRNKYDKSKKLVIPLKHGTLLIMRGAMQHHWQHSVPKRARVLGSRFNLTFRHIKTA